MNCPKCAAPVMDWKTFQRRCPPEHLDCPHCGAALLRPCLLLPLARWGSVLLAVVFLGLALYSGLVLLNPHHLFHPRLAHVAVLLLALCALGFAPWRWNRLLWKQGAYLACDEPDPGLGLVTNKGFRRIPARMLLEGLAGALGLAVLVYGLLFANSRLFDADLEPEAATLLRQLPEQQKRLQLLELNPQNAFFTLLGFTNAKESDPALVGMEILKKLQNKKTTPPITFSRTKETDTVRPDTILQEVHYGKFLLLHADAAEQRALDLAAEKNNIFLQRYQTLVSLPTYADAPLPHAMAAPLFASLRPLQQTHLLALCLLARQAQTGNTDHRAHALNELQRIGRFWRLVANSTTNASVLLTARENGWYCCAAASGILASTPQLVRDPAYALAGAQTRKLFEPLSPAERDATRCILPAFYAAVRFVSQPLNQTFSQSGLSTRFWMRILHPLYKRNKTVNALYHGLQTTTELSYAPASRAQSIRAWIRPFFQRLKSPSARLDNPYGTVLLERAFYLCYGYLVIPHPLEFLIRADAMSRLCTLQLNILEQGVAEKDIQTFLDNASPAFNDPFTGEPAQFDAQHGTIVYKETKTIVPVRVR